MQHKMLPLIDLYQLDDALLFNYGIYDADLRNLLFDDGFANDCCKKYYIEGPSEYDPNCGLSEEEHRIVNCVETILQDNFPNSDCIIIDISW